MKKLKLFLAAIAAMVTMGVYAQGWTAQAPADGDFYLYNVGTGKFLSCGENYGTRSVVGNGALKFTLASNGSGAYTLYTTSTFSYGNPNSAQLQSSGFVDQNVTATTWTFTVVDGMENTYIMQNAAGTYLSAPSDGTIVALLSETAPTDAYGYWKLVNKENLFPETASATNPVDVTCLIGDANFESSNGTMQGFWTIQASNKNLCGGDSPNKCAESYRSTFTLTQVLNDVPNGEYELTAQGFYRQDGSDNEHLPVFYINEKTATFPLRTGTENSMGAASASFTSGLYTINPIHVTVGDGKITLGAKLEGNTMLWCIWDNFTLKYLGVDLSAYETQISTLRETLTGLKDEPMKATVKTTVETALSETASVSQTQSAMEAAIAQLNSAIEAANASIANYADAKAYLDKASTLDAAGQAAYAANETVAALQTAYDDASFEALTDEQKTALDAAIIVAVKAQTTAGSDWTYLIVNPSFENGFSSGWTNNGMDIQNNTSFAKDGNNYCEKWQPNGTVKVSQVLSAMPAGVYKLTVKALTRNVTSGKVFAGGIEVATKIADEVNTYTVEFACDDNADVTIGFEGVGTGAGASWIALDDFHLTLVGAGLPDVTAVTGKMNAEIAAAQNTAIETYNANRTVANYNAASSAIADAEASVAAYATVPTAIEKANAVKTAHNFASEAATTTFANAIAEIQTGYDEGTLTNDQANAAATTLGVATTGWHGGNDNAAAVYLRDGFALGEIAADPALHVNTWSTEGDTDGSGFSIPFYESWTPDANSLPESTLTGTLTDLPNGLYKVSAWVRVAAKSGVNATDAAGITMNVNNGTAVDVTEGEVIGTTQRSIATYEAEGLVKQGQLTLNFNIAADANISWLAFKNVKYIKVRDLTPEEAFVAATAEDYAALNAAIEAHTLGFEAGEYAPYNNIDALATLAAAKAIDQEAENAQEDVQAATAAITNATWTANTAEVNAVYDGSFEADYSGQSGNVQPIGWYRNEGTYSGDGYNVRYVTVPSGIEGNTSGHGLFGKFTMQYGKMSGYTLPLKAGYYKLQFKYGGYGEKGERIVKLIGDTETTVATITSKNNAANTSADAYTAFSELVNIPADGDYVLSFYRQNTSSQNQIAIVDITLFRATADDFKGDLQAEIAKAEAIDVTANVGEGVFQKPATAATALTTAISDAQAVYDNADATVAEVLAATESVKTAVETYNNAELNAPDAGKRYSLTIVENGKAWNGNAITFIAGGRSDQGGYGVKYLAPANKNLAQALKLTPVSGNKYKVSVATATGSEQYITTAKLGYNTGTNEQIRTTDDIDKALEIEIKATATTGQFQLYNTAASKLIANNNNNDVYTANSANFTIAEAEAAEIAINTTAAGWGTTMLPFAVAEIPEGVKVYTCAEASGATLTLVEVEALEANKPYIIEGAWDATLTGDAQGAALSYTEGLLTGTYVLMEAEALNGKYIMQKQGEKVGFFLVNSENAQPKLKANRAYMTAPATGSVKAFLLGDDAADAIQSVFDGLVNGDAYDLGGRKVSKLQKGNVYIVNGKKVVVK